MGPDCGTAIINGVPLAFANVVRRGKIGCIGASGTGLQQVTCLVDRQGAGISQAIGTGSHDLHKSVGGITMLQGIAALGGDPDTTVLVLISKPPAPEVAQKVLAAASKIGKPVVVNFIGAEPASIKGKNLYPVTTLEEAAAAAVALSRGRRPGRRRSVPTRAARCPVGGGTTLHPRALQRRNVLLRGVAAARRNCSRRPERACGPMPRSTRTIR